MRLARLLLTAALLTACYPEPAPESVCVSDCGVHIRGTERCPAFQRHEDVFLGAAGALPKHTREGTCEALRGLAVSIEPAFFSKVDGRWCITPPEGMEHWRCIWGTTDCEAGTVRIASERFEANAELAHEFIHILDACQFWRGTEHLFWAQDFGGIETAVTDAGVFISGSGP